jgi:hypothetical protein
MDICRTDTRSASFFAIVSMLVGMATACGGEDTYSAKNSDIISYDCQQTAPCDTVFSIRPDAVSECIEDTSTKLDRGSDAQRAMYEMRFNRCSTNTGCDYFSCASDNNLFSIANEQKIRYDCTQQSVCKIQSGQPTMSTDNDTCFQALSKQLDFSTVPDRASWEQRFARCGTQMGCAYTNCK